MKYANLIEAIKAVRLLSNTATRIEKTEQGKYEIISTVGLKDAKDMVEAIMELGVQRFLDDELRRRQQRASHIDSYVESRCTCPTNVVDQRCPIHGTF